MSRTAISGLMVLFALSPTDALAEGRALVVETENAGWEREATAKLRARLEAAGFELIALAPEAIHPVHEPDVERFRALSKQGLVSLARGRLDDADSLLAEALAELGEQVPRGLAQEAIATCLDHARVAYARGGEARAVQRVEACRRGFPFAEVDRRRVPPEIHSILEAVDARRVGLVLAPEGSECQVHLPGDDAPLVAPTALPGVEVEVRVECADGVARARKARFEEGAVVDVRLTLDDRFSPGPPARLKTRELHVDALALAERHSATVFVLARDEAGALLVRSDGSGVTVSRGDRPDQALETLLRGPASAPKVKLGRVTSWTLGALGAALFVASLPPMRRRVKSAEQLSETAYHDPAFIELRDEFDSARAPLRRRAVIGGLSGLAAGALAERPLPRSWAIASAGAGALLLITSVALVASAPSCEPGQDTFMSCLAREAQRDRALLMMMASAPLFSVSSRSLLAKGRGLSVQADARSFQVSFHISRPPGPRARDGVWFHTKE